MVTATFLFGDGSPLHAPKEPWGRGDASACRINTINIITIPGYYYYSPPPPSSAT
jgi:hypothetical protein